MGPLNFVGTGNAPVDQVLWAVECAATDYHNTNEWSEPTDDGPSHVELIQTAAKSAAAELDRLRAENAALRKAALEVFYNSVTNCECTTVRESDMIALGEVLGVYGVQAKPANNGSGGA